MSYQYLTAGRASDRDDRVRRLCIHNVPKADDLMLRINERIPNGIRDILIRKKWNDDSLSRHYAAALRFW